MKATSDLENDHVYILKLCDIMEKITHAERPDISHLEDIVDLIRNFADGLHHRKEEDLLFPKMSEKGFSLHSGPLAVMMMDHQAGRSYVKGMAGGIEAYKAGDTTVREEIFENMIGYVELLRSHIAKENNVLFRMADNCLSDEENKELLAEFALAEQKHNGNKTFADYVSRIENLSVIYEI